MYDQRYLPPTPRQSVVYSQPGQPGWSPHREPTYTEISNGDPLYSSNTLRAITTLNRGMNPQNFNVAEQPRNSKKRVKMHEDAGYEYAQAADGLLMLRERALREQAANTLVELSQSKSKSQSKSQSKRSTNNSPAKRPANGGQINIYTGPKNGKYIIKNGVKVYINSNSITNKVQYKKTKSNKR